MLPVTAAYGNKYIYQKQALVARLPRACAAQNGNRPEWARSACGLSGTQPLRRLLLVVVNRDRVEVPGFKNLPAVLALNIIDTVTPGNDFGAAVLTDGFHKPELSPILFTAGSVSSPMNPGIPAGVQRNIIKSSIAISPLSKCMHGLPCATVSASGMVRAGCAHGVGAAGRKTQSRGTIAYLKITMSSIPMSFTLESPYGSPRTTRRTVCFVFFKPNVCHTASPPLPPRSSEQASTVRSSLPSR